MPLTKPDGTYHSLVSIMHSLKRYTARQANLLLVREGQFWQHESYDHVVRDEAERVRIVSYFLSNPEKAGLVASGAAWPWLYSKDLQ
jgi:REP element-mobilizing transposase RayT